jgi:murein DD-endopeptidase MepM/ murein hydrolase activator NlpD
MGSAGKGDGSFDPGIETGYLRRAARDQPLDPDLGAAPFDPGSGTGYDERRARKTARRREREERKREEAERKRREAEERHRRAELIARQPGGPAAAAPAVDPVPVDPVPVEPEHQPDPAPVVELRGLRPQRPSLAERLEREREERRRAEGERRARIERERADREHRTRDERDRRRGERIERLRSDLESLRRAQRELEQKHARTTATPAPRRTRAAQATRPPRVTRATSHPRVTRAPRPIRRRTLIWPTAKAGFAITLVLAIAAALGSAAGLPVPGLNPTAGGNLALSSSSLFGVDPGTAPGLTGTFVFPVGGSGPHDYGEGAARFGAPRYGHIHEGQDVFAKPGTPLYAVRDGVVIDGGGGKSFYAYGGGNSFVMYSPTDDRSYVYLHMQHPSALHAGDQVHAGQLVGEVGCTGSCDGPHLHFEIRRGRVGYGHEAKPIDPLPYLQQWERLGTG